MAATDPANLYGSVLPWPTVEARLARDAGAYVFLNEGQLIAYLEKGRRHLTLLTEDPSIYAELGRSVAGIAALHRRMTLHTVGEDAAPQSPMAPTLREWGFAPAPKGLAYRR
jgi:ATP-dependent Lhr-like helicase